MKRSSGVFLHITSLPSHYGIGSLGKEAYDFARRLSASGQRYWQILPLCQPDKFGSPYASEGSFSGNVLLIDCEKLCEYGLLSRSELSEEGGACEADFAKAERIKLPLFAKAYANLPSNALLAEEFGDFCEENAEWLRDYALYSSISSRSGKPFYEWEKELKFREKQAVEDYAKNNANDVEYRMFLQFLFFRQWKELKSYANSLGVGIIGDIPMYVSYNSADVWSSPEEFLLDDELRPKKVAGVPPDYFSEEGQLWGNPLYNWDYMRAGGYKWWKRRIRRCAELFDALRIDHFRAFHSYWAVDADSETAKNGVWISGEGKKFVDVIKEAAGGMKLIAEDLGEYEAGVQNLRKECGISGMKVLEFAFSGGSDNAFLPHNYEEDCVAYIGTHDNDTAVGWWESLPYEEKSYVYNYTGFESDKEINRKLMKLLSRSRAETVIFCAQDIIGLSSDRRMNVPGKTGCWRFMLDGNELKSEDMDYLGEITMLFGRTASDGFDEVRRVTEKPIDIGRE